MALLGAASFTLKADEASAQQALGRGAETRIVLPNGMVVVVAEDHQAPLVGLELHYGVGFADDPPDRAGLAELTLRMMTKQSGHLSYGQYQNELDAIGALYQRWTMGIDSSLLRATVPSDAIAVPLWLWSDQMGFFGDAVSEKTVHDAVQGMENDRSQSVDNVPLGRETPIVMAALYPQEHPYHTGLDHGVEGLQGVTARDVQAFAATHFSPARATLVVVGDLSTSRAIELVRRYFATLPRSTPAPRPTAPPSALTDEVRLRIAARTDTPSVAMVWPTAAWLKPGDAALDLAASFLAGNRTDWLRWKLVSDLKIATKVTASQRSHDLGSEFWINATAARGHTAAELERAIDDALDKLRQEGIPRDGLEGARTGFLLQKIFDFGSLAGGASLLMECETHGVHKPCAASWVHNYEAVNAHALFDVLNHELPRQFRVVAEVVPTADAPVAGKLRPDP